MQAAESFWAMGGYAAYVWPAYLCALLVLGYLSLTSLVRWRRLKRRSDGQP